MRPTCLVRLGRSPISADTAQVLRPRYVAESVSPGDDGRVTVSDPTPDVRGRTVVWSVGELPSGTSARPRRRVLRWLGLTLASLAAVAALVSAVAAWSIASPVGTTPATPLWLAPGVAAGPTSRPPASTPAATPTQKPTVRPTVTALPSRPAAPRTSRPSTGSRHTGQDERARGSTEHRDPATSHHESSKGHRGSEHSGSGAPDDHRKKSDDDHGKASDDHHGSGDSSDG